LAKNSEKLATVHVQLERSKKKAEKAEKAEKTNTVQYDSCM
jgi:hypothetical protein